MQMKHNRLFFSMENNCKYDDFYVSSSIIGWKESRFCPKTVSAYNEQPLWSLRTFSDPSELSKFAKLSKEISWIASREKEENFSI